MQYKVPQNIDLEDKIVGPFTMKQFLYLFVGGFIIYGWWSYSSQFVNEMTIFLTLAIPLGLICFCLAVVKVNDRPFEMFIVNCIKFLSSPKQRKWITGYVPETVITLDPLEAKKEEHVKTETDLDDLAKSLEQQTAEIRAKAQTNVKSNTAGKPESLNLSVSDIGNAASKQQQAQDKTATVTQAPSETGKDQKPAPAQKKGFMGIFK